MNFRFTKKKIIGSVIIPIIFLTIVWGLLSNTPALIDNPTIWTGFLSTILLMHDFTNIFALGSVLFFVLEMVFVYLLWSLFQKK
jgi:predicted benzoate:H+ symporter BenE